MEENILSARVKSLYFLSFSLRKAVKRKQCSLQLGVNDWAGRQTNILLQNANIRNSVLVAKPGDWDPNESHPQAMSRDDIEVLSCHPDHSAYVQ